MSIIIIYQFQESYHEETTELTLHLCLTALLQSQSLLLLRERVHIMWGCFSWLKCFLCVIWTVYLSCHNRPRASPSVIGSIPHKPANKNVTKLCSIVFPYAVRHNSKYNLFCSHATFYTILSTTNVHGHCYSISLKAIHSG